jgi:hypothetical protein
VKKETNTVEDENEHEHEDDLGESGVPVVNDTRSSGLEMLKGREERAIKTSYNDTLLSWVVSTFDLPPLQGVSLGGRFPGLKPWAESYSPFGA